MAVFYKNGKPVGDQPVERIQVAEIKPSPPNGKAHPPVDRMAEIVQPPTLVADRSHTVHHPPPAPRPPISQPVQPALVTPGAMLCVLPYSAGDAASMADLLKWCGELGGCEHYQALLVQDEGTPVRIAAAVQAAAEATFKAVDRVIIRGTKKLKWPAAATVMFIGAARYIAQNNPRPFFWCEADCIPVKSTWLFDLEAQQIAYGQPFLGCVVEFGSSGSERHLTGCAVYPADAIHYVQHLEADAQAGKRVAWDLHANDRIMPVTRHTDLVQHSWGMWKDPPTFVEHREWNEPSYIKTLGSIEPGAAVFHRCKDGSLTRLLRKQRCVKAARTVPVSKPSSAGEPPKLHHRHD